MSLVELKDESDAYLADGSGALLKASARRSETRRSPRRLRRERRRSLDCQVGMTNRIFLSAPDIGDLEAKYVAEAIASGWVAPAGPDLDEFESELARRVGATHAVGLSSGTAGLHLGLLALGVRPGDVVITSTMTFAATANAIVYAGAQPYFVDSSRETGNVEVALMALAASKVQRERDGESAHSCR